MSSYWLMKSEPEEREPGVKFSVDDFEAVKTTSWEGVRNPEACRMMKEKMRVGDRVLFYHSNCKIPGVAALAEVCREGYPDYNAWDPTHRYYDKNSTQEKPKWYMVDVKLMKRADHFVPLWVLKGIAAGEVDLGYLTEEQVKEIGEMTLLRRGRLSVQAVSERAYDTVVQMSERGGWTEQKGGKGLNTGLKRVRESGARSEGVEKRRKRTRGA
ncbi:hypothetical protein BS47DRAFT_603558 [Hydnum rufescens UP504]|uniref:EVE domain-containing protein n=1 Tax=Hydnum rufescens UP504 TaxID=1448309 RepID=A0A9P6B3R1_9AGAM|nr:hypothetical protein BS47DRAFT_603558 [Hydnum rufescens UP504]